MSSAQGGGDPRPVTAETPAVSGRVRSLVVVVWVLLLAHFVATFVWAAPGYVTGRPDDEPRAGVHRVLETYMTPFAQSWSIFAPSPLHVEYALRVRGVYASGPDGGLVPGPWIDTTAVEVRALTGHLLPSATERPARRLASDARTAYLALPAQGRAIVLARSSGPGGPEVGEAVDADPWPGLRAALLDAGASPYVVDQYLGKDHALAAYATQVLRASASVPGAGATGDDLVYVQASIVRHTVAPYGTGERPEPTELLLGARPPAVVPGQGDAAFRDSWSALLAESVTGEGAR